jgi:hypothetical protein
MWNCCAANAGAQILSRSDACSEVRFSAPGLRRDGAPTLSQPHWGCCRIGATHRSRGQEDRLVASGAFGLTDPDSRVRQDQNVKNKVVSLALSPFKTCPLMAIANHPHLMETYPSPTQGTCHFASMIVS